MYIINYETIFFQQNISIIKNTIENDGILIYPTDTLYGLGGNFFSVTTMKKIDYIKNRKDLPYSAAVSDFNMLERLVETIPPIFYHLAEKLLPGKFTFLFKASGAIDRKLLKSSNKIGIRIPDIPGLLKLIKILNTPLISTSVNRTGGPPLNDPAAIREFFSVMVPPGQDLEPLLIDKGILPQSRGSTILDITVSPIHCIREGDDFNRLSELDIELQLKTTNK
ncbi:MAG: L-threonylcarbamoyladenylate synthase [Acidobacteria bacterium]|jgi:L-threonylcarbamoyladenylate synthase|nr:L-threonylcarbamoyladenylate synthase [Acidobacteriota bacterium]